MSVAAVASCCAAGYKISSWEFSRRKYSLTCKDIELKLTVAVSVAIVLKMGYERENFGNWSLLWYKEDRGSKEMFFPRFLGALHGSLG